MKNEITGPAIQPMCGGLAQTAKVAIIAAAAVLLKLMSIRCAHRLNSSHMPLVQAEIACGTMLETLNWGVLKLSMEDNGLRFESIKK